MKKYIPFLIVFTLFLTACFHQNTEDIKSAEPENTSPEVGQTFNPPSPPAPNPSKWRETKATILYQQEISSIQTEDRSWPTVKLWKKAPGKDPESLAEVGRVHEYPVGFVLSPDKKFLVINLETKVQMLDLTTRELRDLSLVPKQTINSIVFSSDGQKLLMGDGFNGAENSEFYLHQYSLTENKDTVRKIANAPGSSHEIPIGGFHLSTWRSDNIVLVLEAKGEAGRWWYIDLNAEYGDPQFIPTNHDIWASYIVNSSGHFVSKEKGFIPDPCNDFDGAAVSTFEMIDPITNKSFGVIGDQKTALDIVAISSDDKEILYMTHPIAKKVPEDCDKKEYSFFKAVRGDSGKVMMVSDFESLLSSWHVQTNQWSPLSSYLAKDDFDKITSIYYP